MHKKNRRWQIIAANEKFCFQPMLESIIDNNQVAFEAVFIIRSVIHKVTDDLYLWMTQNAMIHTSHKATLSTIYQLQAH